MSEMIERVAKALVDTYNQHVPASVAYDDLPEPYRDNARACARAVIAAMREPTNGMAMIGGGLPVFNDVGDSADFVAKGQAASEVYQAMIGEALMEYPPE